MALIQQTKANLELLNTQHHKDHQVPRLSIPSKQLYLNYSKVDYNYMNYHFPIFYMFLERLTGYD
jgi:hypothetical protein